LVYEVLASNYKTYTTKGNLNNHIGVPLTLLSVQRDAEMAVIEMGANHQKEIESYCTYTLPTHGLITNCGKAHLEGFGGEAGVRKGKGELFDYLRANGGMAFIMSDYPYLVEMSKGIAEVRTYGTANAEIIGRVVPHAGLLQVEILDQPGLESIQTNLVGEYNLPNVLVAVAIGKYFNVPPESIKTSLENYYPSNSRSQLVTRGTNQVVLDAYNANPTSMKAAIENFAKIDDREKVLLLGAMMELGNESLAEHKALVELIGRYRWKAVVLVGGDFEQIEHPYNYFPGSLAAREWLKTQSFEHTSMLVKGSRSMQMEKVLD